MTARDRRDRELGIRPGITRRDFVGQTLMGSGATLLWSAAPGVVLAGCRTPATPPEKDAWWGWGAVGDYASSPGNARSVADAAHRIRDGVYDEGGPPHAIDTGEEVDLAIVGGGMSGLGAAWHFRDRAAPDASCLVLDNHAMFGGEAKENEFLVDGVRLVGPQGSNDFGVPPAGSGSIADRFFERMAIPRDFEYVDPHPSAADLRFSHDSYAPMTGIAETAVDVGYWFAGRGWVGNMWRDRLESAPFPADVRRDLLRWRETTGEAGEDFRRRLDRVTYADWLEGELGLRPEVTRYVEPIVGLINGATPDAVSANAAAQIGMPGVAARLRSPSLPHSFPGGNTAFARYLVRGLVPDAMAGGSFDEVLNGRVAFAALDRPGAPTRIRLGATVVDVRHVGTGAAERVRLTYEHEGRLHSVRARHVVLASGGWVNRRIAPDMPDETRRACAEFRHAPALVVNVALTNWRFLRALGFTACRWVETGSEPFGFCCSLRRPMAVGGFRAPLDPERPIVLTFYMGLGRAGLPLADQCVEARTRLFDTTFYDYERRLREHMIELFGDAGFDPEADIAGIVLNRWGHARLAQQPGYFYGTDGRAAPREIVERGWGRIAVGHSELNGHQNWTGGLARGADAVDRLLG